MKLSIYIIQRLAGIAISTVLLYAAINGSLGAQRLYIFLTWLVLFCYVVAIFAGTKPKMPTYLTREPDIISWLIAMGFIGVLVWHGWWATAVVSMLNQLFFGIVKHDACKATRK